MASAAASAVRASFLPCGDGRLPQPSEAASATMSAIRARMDHPTVGGGRRGPAVSTPLGEQFGLAGAMLTGRITAGHRSRIHLILMR
jgi:hypothetical protein